ncbi:MAG: hypothetical protein RLZZ175_132 [Bacteroidota bacterium]|jgi:hypothetical protein
MNNNFIKLLVFIFFTICLSNFSFAQKEVFYKIKTLKQSSQNIDTLTIVPGSLKFVQVYGNAQTDSNFVAQLSDKNTLINWPQGADSIKVMYKTFPFNLNKRYYIRDIKSYDSAIYTRKNLFLASNKEVKEELFATKGFTKSGNITRGISLGNTQNVFVNSSLNLQMEGNISDELKLIAAISDQNIPVQPDGNTQQIQQFDRVYVQLEHKKGTLTAGDLLMKNFDSYFLKYNKNVQGALLKFNYNPKENIKTMSAVGIAVAKGKFASMIVPVSEGIQGPYRLQGPNNERFIIVIANSEKIFLDGVQLQRGFDYDYVIDYNSGEITFTSRVIITKFSRVRVDFEYSERNYSRTNTMLHHEETYKNVKMFFDYYSEKDNPNTPITLTLSTPEKIKLSEIGDSLFSAVGVAADSVEFNANLVLYRDTIINNERVFVHTTDATKAIFKVTFSEVGAGNGSYKKLTSSTSNGAVYEYVGPKLGSFAPIRILPTPKLKKMFSVGSQITTSKNTMLYFEVAASENDQNLFSTIDDQDNKGKAVRVGYNINPIAIKASKYKFLANAEYQYLERYFTAIDRFRSVDFDRDWSTTTNTTVSNSGVASQPKGDDHWGTFQLQIASGKLDLIKYTISLRNKLYETEGVQHRIDFSKSLTKKFKLTSNYWELQSANKVWNSTWRRLTISPYYKGKSFENGYEYSVDQNAVKYKLFIDSASTAMNFEQHKFFIRKADSSSTKYSVDYAVRRDFLPNVNSTEFSSSTLAKTLSSNFSKDFKLSRFAFNLAYRELKNLRPNLTEKQSQNTLLGRVDWNLDLMKRAIRSELTYTSSTGRELKRQYVFIPVPTGQGTYVWQDLNEDGVQQVNEYFEKVYNDPNGEFIRTLAPTDEYINVYTVGLNYRLNLNAPFAWKNAESKTKRFFARFSNSSSWQADKKTISDNLKERFNPIANYSNSAQSIDILSNQTTLRSTMFFNRTSPNFGTEIVYINTQRKDLLVAGFEQKSQEDIQLNSRANIKKKVNFRWSVGQNIKGINSDYLADRNYKLENKQIKTELSFQPRDGMRLSGTCNLQYKKNVFAPISNEKADFVDFGTEIRISKLSSKTITLNAKYINIDYTGKLNSIVSYDMLEALQPGKNYTWNVNWQQRLSNGLQLTFVYEGRKSKDKDIVHIGRMQLSALF